MIGVDIPDIIGCKSPIPDALWGQVFGRAVGHARALLSGREHPQDAVAHIISDALDFGYRQGRIDELRAQVDYHERRADQIALGSTIAGVRRGCGDGPVSEAGNGCEHGQGKEDLEVVLRQMRGAALDRQQRRRATERECGECESLRQDGDREFVISQCRVAERWEYGAWLRGFMAAGGRPSLFFDFPQPTFFTALVPLVVRPLFGALSLRIIVPVFDGRQVVGGKTGHTDLYFMGSFKSLGFYDQPATVAVWSDTELS